MIPLRNCINPLTWTDHRDTCHTLMKWTWLDNEGICYWYSIIPSRLKCYGEISWSVSRLSFSLITAWPLPSLYGYLKWENITSMTGYKDTCLWYDDKKIVSQSSNWLTQSAGQIWEWFSNNSWKSKSSLFKLCMCSSLRKLQLNTGTKQDTTTISCCTDQSSLDNNH